MERDFEDTQSVRLVATTKIEGVVLPTWLAVSVGALLVALIFVLGIVHQQQRTMAEQSAARDKLIEREYRILQLHIQDLEAAVIRANIAKRGDFAEWDEARQETSKGD